MTYWVTPRLWPGQTVTILGGGPSLSSLHVGLCKDRTRVIAINDAYLMAPWADVHYFCDKRWWKWHKDREEYKQFQGVRVTMDNPEIPGTNSIKNMGREGLNLDPAGVSTGCNSGIQAINMAVHFGFSRILLLGYDMKPGHWHGGHPTPTRPGVYREVMLPLFDGVARGLERLGIEVINCTPNSALTVFPCDTIRRALEA